MSKGGEERSGGEERRKRRKKRVVAPQLQLLGAPMRCNSRARDSGADAICR